jgi:predicted outer membrane protein
MLAMGSSQDHDVKSFARTMLDDRTQLASELKEALPAGLKVRENVPDRIMIEACRGKRGSSRCVAPC